MTRTQRRTSHVSQLVKSVLAAQPGPPRAVSYARVLKTVAFSSLGFAGFGFGAMGMVVGIMFLALARGDLWPVIIGLWFLAFGVGIAAIVLIFSARVHRGLTYGILTDSRITSLSTREGPGRRTLDAMANGYAEGRRLVKHPLGEFEAPFRFDGAGASHLDIGAHMPVLVDADRRRVIIEAQ